MNEFTPDELYIHLEADLAFGVDRIPDIKQASCRKCPLCETRTNLVMGAGNPKASLMFVGEAPGFEEDKQGLPFVGKAGQLLTKMIQAMGFSRDQVYITNVLKCRPPDNRTPLATEIQACAPLLDAQIQRIKPKIIVALGSPAAKTLLNRTEGVQTLRGEIYPYKIPGVCVAPTFHPAYLLRNETEKKKAWMDLKMVMAYLKEEIQIT